MTIPDSPLAGRLRRERILLTGATGFVGSALLAKLLRVTPGGESVHVLLRTDARASARERLVRDVLSSSAFRAAGLGPEAAERIQVVEGDLTREGLGMTDEDRRTLADSVTAIVHSAASCAFDQPLDTAVQVNALGTERLLRLASEAGSVPFVHISTAFVSGPGDGSVPEEVLPRGHTARSLRDGAAPGGAALERAGELLEEAARARDGRDPTDGHRAAQLQGLRAARARGWRTAYTLTKALAEQILAEERGDVPVTILRPSIIEAAVDDPTPGWIEGLPGVTGIVAELAMGRLPAAPGYEGSVLDLVPVDRVVNAVLASVPGTDGLRVVHVTSGDAGRPSIHELTRALGPVLQTDPPQARAVPVQLPLPVLEPDEIDAMLQERARALRGEGAREARLLSRLRTMVQTYRPFMESNPVFTLGGLPALHESLTPADRALFPVETWNLDWSDYMTRSWYPGVLRILDAREPAGSTAAS